MGYIDFQFSHTLLRHTAHSLSIPTISLTNCKRLSILTNVITSVIQLNSLYRFKTAYNIIYFQFD